MECYQCLQGGITREAAGLRQHCLAALCQEHTCVVEGPITLTHLMAPSEEGSKILALKRNHA
jgi:hypothetical protein